MKSTVLIIRAAMRDAGNSVAMQMGWGPDSYSVPLTPGDGDEVTHYGLHTWAGPGLEDWVTGTTPLPEGMEAAQPVIGALIYSFRDDIKNRGHFNAVLAAHSLAHMPVEDVVI